MLAPTDSRTITTPQRPRDTLASIYNVNKYVRVPSTVPATYKHIYQLKMGFNPANFKMQIEIILQRVFKLLAIPDLA